jgi:thioredoxin 1
MALAITDATFEEVVLKSDKPVMVDWAAWCGPCRMVGPIIDELGTEYDGKVVVGKWMWMQTKNLQQIHGEIFQRY